MTELGENQSCPQLQMVWPEHLLAVPPAVQLPPGYSLRAYRPGDKARFYQIMELAGWPDWNDEKLQPWLARIPPGSWFMAVHEKSEQIVATAMGLHNHTELHPFGGELGWMAGDPAHAGQGLGMAVAAAVTARLIDAGYRNLHLYTEQWRPAALKTYLKLGYAPLLYTSEMLQRWQAICAQLQWPFTPEKWKRYSSTISTLIFDLSEVLIAGLLGIEKTLADRLELSEKDVLSAFGSFPLEQICRGRISEDVYLTRVIEKQQWSVPVDLLKRVIRQNLHLQVPGMIDLLHRLSVKYELVLLSDHAAEWVQYLQNIHPFLTLFDHQVYSFETGLLKLEAPTFERLLQTIGREPAECLFIDDNPHNVHTANTVGIAGIRFRATSQLVAKLSEYGVLV